MRNFAWLGIALLVGCGGGGGGGGSSAPAAPPVIPPAVLTGLQVLPSTGTLDLGDSLALSVLGLYSDGSKKPVAAAWSSNAPAVVSVPAGSASVCVAEGEDEGSATVQASFGGFNASADLDVVDAIPADPGPYYAATENGEILEYPVGGGAPSTVATPDYAFNGIVMNRAGTALFAISNSSIHRIDLPGYGSTPIATTPADPNVVIGLVEEESGTLLSIGYGTGSIHRIDPATGSVTPMSTGPVQQNGVALRADGALYTTTIVGGGVSRTIVTTGATTTWASAGAAVSSGLAINRRGEAFTGDTLSPTVLRCVDLNGDGDAMDAGEETAFATLPADAIYGFGIAGGGSVLVNNQPWGFAAGTPGIYWLRDLNGDGDAADADEATLISATAAPNGIDGSLAAPR